MVKEKAFKNNKERGEHRNGRKSTYKHHATNEAGEPNEYINRYKQ